MTFRFCGLDLPNNIFLAPLAGVADRSFRALALEQGAGLAFSEMISAVGLVRGDRKTRSLLPAPAEAARVGVQLFGSRPEHIRDAAAIVDGLDVPLVDLNCGCPVRKVVKGGSGAALLRDPGKVAALVAAARSATAKPVLVKIRAGWDERSVNAVAVARAAEDAGAAAITVHGRTAAQQFTGRADWRVVAAVAAAVRVPVVGNGDLVSPGQVDAALAAHGCAAVMIGRGALGNPWIFRAALARRRGEPPAPPTAAELAAVMVRHCRLAREEHGERAGVHLMRRHLVWYSRGRPGAHEFRRRVTSLERPEEVEREIEDFVLHPNAAPAGVAAAEDPGPTGSG
jgi:nifR3 family TIM-barrel protein